jgi:CNT family concentrative nucleoside transporter
LEHIGRGLLGVFGLIGILYVLSRNRRAINWRLVGAGLLLQLTFALLVLKVPQVSWGFDQFAQIFTYIIEWSEYGAGFLLGDMATSKAPAYIFAFRVLPTVMFYSALSAILFYYGVMQKIVFGIAWVLTKSMGLSGPESFAAAANVFIGQTEAPLVIKPYLAGMSRSELLCLMVGGMANIAGGVFAAYVGFLGGSDPEHQLYIARHLLSASIMSKPLAMRGIPASSSALVSLPSPFLSAALAFWSISAATFGSRGFVWLIAEPVERRSAEATTSVRIIE